MRWLYIAIFTALFVLPAMIVLEALLAYYVCIAPSLSLYL